MAKVNHYRTIKKLENFGKNILDPVVRVTLQPLPENAGIEMTPFSSNAIYEYLPVFNFIMLMFIIAGILTIVIRYIRKMKGQKRKLSENRRSVPFVATEPPTSDIPLENIPGTQGDEEAEVSLIQCQPPVFHFKKLYPKLDEAGTSKQNVP